MQQRSEETRRQILEAAQNQFAAAGYDATGVAEICAAAGVSKGAFYHHFPTKQSVFLTLLENWLGGLETELSRAMQADGNAAQRLMNMTDLMKLVFDAADGRLPMFLEFWRQAAKDETVWQATIAPYRRFEERFTQLVEDGVREGSLTTQDSLSTARTILALALGMLLQGVLDPKTAAWDQETRQGIEYLLSGISRRKT